LNLRGTKNIDLITSQPF